MRTPPSKARIGRAISIEAGNDRPGGADFNSSGRKPRENQSRRPTAPEGPTTCPLLGDEVDEPIWNDDGFNDRFSRQQFSDFLVRQSQFFKFVFGRSGRNVDA